MRDTYTFDSEAFLATLAALTSRFEQVVASSALSFDGIDDDAANPIQHPERRDDGVAPARVLFDDGSSADGSSADDINVVDDGQSCDERGVVRKRMRNSEGKEDARIL